MAIHVYWAGQCPVAVRGALDGMRRKISIACGPPTIPPAKEFGFTNLIQFFRKIKHVYYNYVRFVTFVHEAILVKF
jgi:hypothetical protein